MARFGDSAWVELWKRGSDHEVANALADEAAEGTEGLPRAMAPKLRSADGAAIVGQMRRLCATLGLEHPWDTTGIEQPADAALDPVLAELETLLGLETPPARTLRKLNGVFRTFCGGAVTEYSARGARGNGGERKRVYYYKLGASRPVEVVLQVGDESPVTEVADALKVKVAVQVDGRTGLTREVESSSRLALTVGERKRKVKAAEAREPVGRAARRRVHECSCAAAEPTRPGAVSA